MKNLEQIKSLLNWMENNLNRSSQLNEGDIASFFAENFIINTNGRIVEATPETYHGYLNSLKETLVKVSYDLEEVFEAPDKVVAVFTIHLDFFDKAPQSLRTISIFKFDKNHRITEWREVFADAHLQKFSYDVS